MSDYENYEPHAAEAFLFVPGVTDQNYDVRPLKRSKVLHCFLIVPCMWAGISWLTGGCRFLTDLAFSTMLVICVILVCHGSDRVFTTIRFRRNCSLRRCDGLVYPRLFFELV